MESPEVKKQKLIAQLVAAVNRHINQTGEAGTANYVQVPDKNIEAIARKFGVSVADAQQMLKDYFANQLN
ncbi:MAG: hypothetical protein WC428_01750 [Candidatus Paceibacterota bacterium]|jgi:NACalpha-BTF3-like transcription factor